MMNGFTLIELVIVMMIISVLATLAFFNYGVYREKAMDREVQANLAMIIAAERIYHMDRQTYYVSDDESDLNGNLRLFVTTTNMNWDYLTNQNVAATPVRCCAQATRTADDGRTWRMCTSENAPVKGSCAGNAANCP